ncbi:lipase (class 3) domain-containing protein [Ditylenchus destructor]|nr:lipase (class 3) domain-containing protein [Ditylenchus destructor]
MHPVEYYSQSVLMTKTADSSGLKWCVSTRKCESAWTVATAKCAEVDRVAHAFNCPLSPPVRYGFLDDFARTRALPFIAASSADTDQQIRTCLENNVPNTNLLRRYAVSCEFVKVLIEAINIAIYAQKDFEPVGGKVVANFYDAFFKLWKAGLEVDLRQTMFQHPTAELWVFGHSLGGSIASLAAAWIARLGMIGTERIRFVSFGQPRTGNLEFAQTFDNLVPYKYRVVHKGDCVSKLPARIPITDSSLFHHRYEVWYNNNMLAGDAYEVCESADSSACSGSVTDPESLSSTNHLQYYNVSLYSWFRTGCASKSHLKLRPKFPFHEDINMTESSKAEQEVLSDDFSNAF